MNSTLHTFWRRLATHGAASPAERLLLALLTPLSWQYAAILRIRARLYHWGVLSTRRLPKPVIAIGNITVGGTGKTPVTAYIARYLLAQGHRVAVISRGYGGSLEGQTTVVSDGVSIMAGAAECGDEPYLLASTVPGLMVVIGPDRYSAGLLAMEQLAPDIFLLDDAFQHLRLHRDLNIVLLDYTHPYGNGLTLPGGLLREPLSALARADLIIRTRSPLHPAAADHSTLTPLCHARHTLVDLLPLRAAEPLAFNRLSGLRVLAFAGIADPDGFFTSLREQGVTLLHCISFPDHTVYGQEQYAELGTVVREHGIDVLVTTEKDGVKLKGLPGELAGRVLLARMTLTIDQPEPLHRLINLKTAV